MRVTFLTQFFPPETFAGANRAASMAEAFAEDGEVHVITLRPGYPDPRLYADLRPDELELAGVDIRRVGEFAPHRRSWFRRAFGEQLMAFRLLMAGLRVPTDLVLATSPGMFLGPAALILARVRRVPFAWDVRDLTWRCAREATGGGPMVLAVLLLERVMWWVARHADLLIAATPGIGEELRRACPDARIVVATNTISSALFDLLDPSEPPAHARRAVTYAGLVGHAQGLAVLCDVAERLPEVDFNIAGEGPDLAEIAHEVQVRGLANVRLHGYLLPAQIAELYRCSDVLFAQLSESALHTVTALPSKLFEYMAAGRPIVYGGDGLAAEAIAKVGCGVSVRPGDAEAICGAIRSVLDDPSGALEMASRGRVFAADRPSRRESMLAEVAPQLERLVADRARAQAA